MSLDAKTQEARSKTLNNSSGRWSIDHGKGLEDLYADAKGSIYTAMGGGNIYGSKVITKRPNWFWNESHRRRSEFLWFWSW